MTNYVSFREKSLYKAKDRDIAEYLYVYMSNLSESHTCAGWLIGLEFRLWNMVCGGSRKLGHDEVAENDIETLERLSKKCGGWWTWKDYEGGPGAGLLFVSFDEWLARVEEQQLQTRPIASPL